MIEAREDVAAASSMRGFYLGAAKTVIRMKWETRSALSPFFAKTAKRFVIPRKQSSHHDPR